MHIEKDRKTGNYGNCPKCIHIKYSSYPQVIHIGWITYVNHVYSRCKDVCNRIWESAVFYPWQYYLWEQQEQEILILAREMPEIKSQNDSVNQLAAEYKKIRKKRRFYLT